MARPSLAENPVYTEHINDYKIITIKNFYVLYTIGYWRDSIKVVSPRENINQKALLFTIKKRKFIFFRYHEEITYNGSLYIYSPIEFIEVTENPEKDIISGKCFDKNHPINIDDRGAFYRDKEDEVFNILIRLVDRKNIVFDIKDEDFEDFCDILNKAGLATDRDVDTDVKDSIDKDTKKKTFYNPICVGGWANDNLTIAYSIKEDLVDRYLKKCKEKGLVISNHDLRRFGLDKYEIFSAVLRDPYSVLNISKRCIAKKKDMTDKLYKKYPDRREAVAIFTNFGIPSRAGESNIDSAAKELYQLVSDGINQPYGSQLQVFYKHFKNVFKDEIVERVDNMLNGKCANLDSRTFSYNEATGILTIYVNKEIIVLDMKNKKVIESYIDKDCLNGLFNDDFLKYDGLKLFTNNDPEGISTLYDLILSLNYPFMEKLSKCKLDTFYNDAKNYFTYLYKHGPKYANQPDSESSYLVDKLVDSTRNNSKPLAKVFNLSMKQIRYINDLFYIGQPITEYFWDDAYRPKINKENKLGIKFSSISADTLLNLIAFMQEIAKHNNINLQSLDENGLNMVIKTAILVANSYDEHPYSAEAWKLLRLYTRFAKIYEWNGLNNNKDLKIFEDTLDMLIDLYIDSKDEKSLANIEKIDFKSISELSKIHDELVQLTNAVEANSRIASNADNQKALLENKKLLERRAKLKYKDDKYTIYAPTNLADIIWEGINLHHCVGGYTDSHAIGSCTILFIRKNEQPDKSFYTIEVDSNFKNVRQIHGYSNICLGNNPDVIPTVVAWAKKNNIKVADYDLREDEHGQLVDIPDRVSIEVIETEEKDSINN